MCTKKNETRFYLCNITIIKGGGQNVSRREIPSRNLRFFIDPSLRPELIKLNRKIKDGLLERDEFNKYIYDNFNRAINSSNYVEYITALIKGAYRISGYIDKALTLSPLDDNRENFDNIINSITDVIKNLKDDIKEYRERAIKLAINELWQDARAFGIPIDVRKKPMYSVIFTCLFIQASYDKKIENALRKLVDIRTRLYSIVSNYDIFDSLDNWKRTRVYELSIVLIDGLTYDYNKFDDERFAIERHFATKL